MSGLLNRTAFDLIISDIDGCLGPEGPSAMDAESLAEVAAFNRRAAELGDLPPLTLCSGRPQPYAEAICKITGNTTTPCICENGVWMYHPGTNEYMMDPAITPDHVGAVRAAAQWLHSEFGKPRAGVPGDVGVSQQPGKAASVSLYHPDTDYLRSLAPRIAEEFRARGWPMRVSMTWLYVNCDLEHITKGTGLDRLMKRLAVPRDRAAGIGDTTGDLPIRERVGFFACPSNAQDQIKAVADYVSPHAEARGVCDILRVLARKGA